ncbi:MAG: hypothetical protein ABI358_13320, partial [Ginsengibacter sp.]
VNNQINDTISNENLNKIVIHEFNGLQLKQKEKDVLKYISTQTRVRPKDYKNLGFKTIQDFSSNFLNKLASQNLLLRKQEGRAVIYELRGLALLASNFDLL